MPASKAGKGDSTAAPTILCGWPSCNSWSSSVNGAHLPDDSKAGVTEGYGAGNTALIGSKWTLGTLTYSFPTSGTFYPEGYAVGTEPSEHVTFNAMQQDALRYALNLITRYTNLNFTEITESTTSTPICASARPIPIWSARPMAISGRARSYRAAVLRRTYSRSAPRSAPATSIASRTSR